MHDKKPVLVIIGSTTSGKSVLAVELAKMYNGEIISVDSRQIYKGLNKITGKIEKEEMCGVPHYMLDVAEVGKEYSVYEFKEQARKYVEEIYKKGKVPILAGGTGFYIDSILFEGTVSSVGMDLAYRKELEKKDIKILQAELRKKDKDAYERIDKQNPRRLIRALEIVRNLGFFPMQQRKERYPYRIIGIKCDRQKLRRKIIIRLEKRFDQMVKEIDGFLNKGIDPLWFERLGLDSRHVIRMWTEKNSKEVTFENLLKAIMAYAKRQETWWKRYPETTWYYNHELKRISNDLNKVYKRVH